MAAFGKLFKTFFPLFFDFSRNLRCKSLPLNDKRQINTLQKNRAQKPKVGFSFLADCGKIEACWIISMRLVNAWDLIGRIGQVDSLALSVKSAPSVVLIWSWTTDGADFRPRSPGCTGDPVAPGQNPVKPVAPGRSQSNQSHSGAPGQTRRTGSNPVKPPANTAMGQILPIRFALRRTSAWLIKDGGDSLEEQNHDAPGGPHPPCNRKQHNVKNL